VRLRIDHVIGCFAVVGLVLLLIIAWALSMPWEQQLP